MKRMNRANLGRTVGSFALGAAAGSAVTLLFAPASGKTVRKQIGLKFKSLERKTEQKIARAKKLLARKADILRDTAAEKLGDTREWLTERLNHRQPAPRRVMH